MPTDSMELLQLLASTRSPCVYTYPCGARTSPKGNRAVIMEIETPFGNTFASLFLSLRFLSFPSPSHPYSPRFFVSFRFVSRSLRSFASRVIISRIKGKTTLVEDSVCTTQFSTGSFPLMISTEENRSTWFASPLFYRPIAGQTQQNVFYLIRIFQTFVMYINTFSYFFNFIFDRFGDR